MGIERVKYFQIDAEAQDLSPNPFETPATLDILETEPKRYGEFLNRVNTSEVKRTAQRQTFFMRFRFQNIGGAAYTPHLGMGLCRWNTGRTNKSPWRYGGKMKYRAVKVFAKDKRVKELRLDPEGLTADTDTENNVYYREPKEILPPHRQLYIPPNAKILKRKRIKRKEEDRKTKKGNEKKKKIIPPSSPDPLKSFGEPLTGFRLRVVL